MPIPRLPNYIRTYRKRAGLTQGEVAFLLGSKSSAGISRHERLKQTPDLETLLAYEMLFQTPVRNLFNSTHREVEQKLKQRIKLLIRKLTRVGEGQRIKKKIEILRACLDELVTFRHAQ